MSHMKIVPLIVAGDNAVRDDLTGAVNLHASTLATLEHYVKLVTERVTQLEAENAVLRRELGLLRAAAQLRETRGSSQTSG